MEEVRDWVLVVALIALIPALSVSLLVLALGGWKTLRGVRRLRRLHDDHVPAITEASTERLKAINEQLSARGGLLGLAINITRLLRSRRRSRKKSPLQRAREALAALRS